MSSTTKNFSQFSTSSSTTKGLFWHFSPAFPPPKSSTNLLISIMISLLIRSSRQMKMIPNHLTTKDSLRLFSRQYQMRKETKLWKLLTLILSKKCSIWNVKEIAQKILIIKSLWRRSMPEKFKKNLTMKIFWKPLTSKYQRRLSIGKDSLRHSIW